jgi:hypothetical protein
MKRHTTGAMITMALIPWTAPTAPPTKGISYVPAHNTPMKSGSRQLLLIAIAKARKWMKDVERGHSFADIARREEKAEQQSQLQNCGSAVNYWL